MIYLPELLAQPPWSFFLASIPTSELPQQFWDNKTLIHHLSINDVQILNAALGAILTDLISITVCSPFDSFDSSVYFDKTSPDFPEFFNTWKVVFPNLDRAFEPPADEVGKADPNYRTKMHETWAVWRLVQGNHGLQRLIFETPSDFTPFAILIQGALRPKAEAYLSFNLKHCLHSIRHLEVGLNADHFLLIELAFQFPNVESFVYTDVYMIDLTMWPFLSKPHHKLQTLTFKNPIASAHLRSIVAFPVLQSFAIPRSSITVEAILKAGIWQEPVHPSLTIVTIDDLSGPVQCRLRFPNVRTVYIAAFPPTNLALQRLCKFFPVIG
ncbi:hypothetical protein BGW39_000039 [Mortierella sp. 14UC]|nr:hypothetical protein BGW39_000039 [Mortierella sp. 14UC]